MFRKILLVVDDSTLSFKPIEAAMECARMSRGEVVALAVTQSNQFHATDRQTVGSEIKMEAKNRENAHVSMDPVLRAARMANVRCDTVVIQSSIASETILEIAQHYYCDAIFIDSRSSFGEADKVFNESVTYKVLELSAIPVLVFRN